MNDETRIDLRRIDLKRGEGERNQPTPSSTPESAPEPAPAPATASARPVFCPFCRSTETELLSTFGSQLSTAQYYCRACHTPFEHIKHESDDTASS